MVGVLGAIDEQEYGGEALDPDGGSRLGVALPGFSLPHTVCGPKYR
jgi:hypothetical protein